MQIYYTLVNVYSLQENAGIFACAYAAILGCHTEILAQVAIKNIHITIIHKYVFNHYKDVHLHKYAL